MKRQRVVPKLVLPILSAVFGLVACGAGPAERETINTSPATLDEAVSSLDLIQQRLKHDRSDQIAAQALEQIQPRLDELNHLIARAEPAPGRVVSFYESEPGILSISERGPRDATPLLTEELSRLSVLDLYRHLSGAEPPEALVRAHERELEASRMPSSGEQIEGGPVSVSTSIPDAAGSEAGDGITGTVQQSLTAADGPWFAANFCFQFQPETNNYGCHPNWANGAWTQAKTRASKVFVAPFSGDFVNVRMQYSSFTQFTDVVFNGQFYSRSVRSGSSGSDVLLRTHRWDVLNAANEGFHFSYGYSWTCQSVHNCNLWVQ
jgi:hypothetical protein